MVSLAERILVVDDEPLMRRVVRRTLVSQGYRCDEADSAERALQKLMEEPTGLVVLDVQMPGKSGADLLPEIRSRHPDTAVIMVTATVDPDTIVRCMKDGAQDYICKPFEPSDIRSRVERALDKKKVELQKRDEQDQLKAKVQEHQKEVRGLFLVAIDSLICALEAKDQYTAGHSRRVANFAIAIGEKMGLADDDLEHLRWGALLHDVGKIGIDSSIQNKPSGLTSEEYAIIASHPVLSSNIVTPLVNERVANIILHHHDRFDGAKKGQTVKFTQIPLEARILTVADTWDAMTSDRPYRKAMCKEPATTELRRCSGTQFDPKVVNAMLEVAKEDY